MVSQCYRDFLNMLIPSFLRAILSTAQRRSAFQRLSRSGALIASPKSLRHCLKKIAVLEQASSEQMAKVRRLAKVLTMLPLHTAR